MNGRKADRKKLLVRAAALAVAGIMGLTVILAAILNY